MVYIVETMFFDPLIDCIAYPYTYRLTNEISSKQFCILIRLAFQVAVLSRLSNLISRTP